MSGESRSVYHCITSLLLLSYNCLHFNGHFPGEPELAGYPAAFPTLVPGLNLDRCCVTDCVQAGLRPICEFMTFNFSMQAIDQVN